MLIGHDPAYSYFNNLGGTEFGRYNTQQMPFVGINHVEVFENAVIVGKLEFRQRMGRKHYLSVIGNYALQDDNFFDLGGTSLTATRIVISASKKNIEVAYSDIFANPTPQTLAKFVSKDDSAEDDLENLSDYDYTNINKVLEKNNIDTFKNGELQKLGNVLLTGSAGFLGVHILYELLHKYNGKVYCLSLIHI